jgi:23S rRNA (guanine1835-N2)-methyltransferase
MKYPYPTPFGDYNLILNTDDKSLRPWDASDEYLLTRLQEMETKPSRILIVNDNHGALTVPLASDCAAGIQDSCLGIREIQENLKLNKLSAPAATGLSDLKDSDPDLIIMKVPKALEEFRFQLEYIKSSLKKDCPFIAAGMNKYLPEAFFNVVKEFCSDASYSRIVKKARCYDGMLTVDAGSEKILAEPSDKFTYNDIDFYSSPGIFSHGKLDGGSRFLLDYLHSGAGNSRVLSTLTKDSTIADPGCGYGILGLQALTLSNASRVVLTDDSSMAVAATEYNARNMGVLEQCSIIQSNILEGIESGSCDLVVCNPPFHRGHTVSVETGFAFIRDSARVLKESGLCLFVVNANLGYGTILKENFKSAAVVKENRKFKLILCRR